MDDDIHSSQQTEEDPTIPGSEAAAAVITLTPENAEAKLAFSEVAEWLLVQNQRPAEHDAQVHARKFMWIASQQKEDREVTSLVQRLATGDLSSSSPVSSQSNRLGSEEIYDARCPNAAVWTGLYYITLQELPQNPERGYTVGSLRLGNIMNDILLCLDSRLVYGVRQRQAILQVHETTARFYIQTPSDRAYNYVKEERVKGQIYLFNDETTLVTFGYLRYRMHYTRLARSDEYSQVVQNYLKTAGSSMSSSALMALTPTPSADKTIVVGDWNLTSGTIGGGSAGKVSIGLNRTGEVAALKRFSVGRSRDKVNQKKETLERISELALRDNEERIVRLIGVIWDDNKGINDVADMWFVLKPALPLTLDSTVRQGLLGTGDSRVQKLGPLLIDILETIAWLHSHNFIHGDIKPENICTKCENETISIVIIDIEDALLSPRTGYVWPAEPGERGTIGWLSPEREMAGFSESADVWAVGVMALWIIRGSHPWRTLVNPWRLGVQFERERPSFNAKYREALAYVTRLKQNGTGPREHVRAREAPMFSDLSDAILGMLRHPYAEQRSQLQARLSANEAARLLRRDNEDGDPKRQKAI